ncbi:hypothetical protein QA584_26470 [Anaerocolumna sp. AGMB13025]|uniref:hypothetical protein n=1 Tax=Anaerocolumna sp. AGMB13025 TaxID=3039116 RepID=UPI00241EDB99|nr:hypothetical protein [Anaerocolumna sp. AGMB13025]WFR57114.1 hypothetical protein QA584_26470 [Anaerocolumna sp. AGMB13025]
MFDINDLKIEGFSPNCLMGATCAIAKYKYDVDNVNKLFFHHSYIYQKGAEVLYLPQIGGLNVWFSREVPISKEEFCKRFYNYYGITHYTADYYDFFKLTNDLTQLNMQHEPVIVEIDFYYMRNHDYYKKLHEQHVMIVYEVDWERKCFQVSDAILGFSSIYFDEFKEYFDDVVLNRNRPIHILSIKKDKLEEKVNIQNFIEDINRSLYNLKDQDKFGLTCLNVFIEDLVNVINIEKEAEALIIPGSWAFMCDSMNCMKFIEEFEKDYPEYKLHVLNEIRKDFTQLYRMWFSFSMGIKEIKINHKGFENNLKKICEIEKPLITKLERLSYELELLSFYRESEV